MQSCQSSPLTTGEEPKYVVQCNGLEVGMVRKQGGMPRQAPFAVVVGCSDARVPTEMIFGQGFNDLFVIRVAGNVLGDVCLGSVDFAVEALSESIKVIVVLGHSGCGAVTGAVDAYLRPLKFWSKSTSPALRSILQKIFVSVREGANCLEEVWGDNARQLTGYRDALIETSVALNAAQAAFALRQAIELAGHWEIEVFYGVYNLSNHQVSMPNDPYTPPSDGTINLAARFNPREFQQLGLKMAEILKARVLPQPLGVNGTSNAASGGKVASSTRPRPLMPNPIKPSPWRRGRWTSWRFGHEARDGEQSRDVDPLLGVMAFGAILESAFLLRRSRPSTPPHHP